LAGPEKSGAELLPDLSKKGLKGLVFHKIIYISSQNLSLQTGLLNFSLPFLSMYHSKNCKNWPLFGQTFSPAAEFFG
jgi:hypothetical protein